MSEVKLNLVDSQQILHGTIHGSIADACVAALSAEPETIAELSDALARYIKPIDDQRPFGAFHSSCHSSVHTALSSFPQSVPLDAEPWDAGIMVIDLAARIVACESTYSQPGPSGEVCYHDGTAATDVPVLYRVPDDWLFVNSVEAYQWSRERRVRQRLGQQPVNFREVLYGEPLLRFIVDALATTAETGLLLHAPPTNSGDNSGRDLPLSVAAEAPGQTLAGGHPLFLSEISGETSIDDAGWATDDPAEEVLRRALSAIHARWLLTPRADLRGQSPRDVMLAKQDFIDFDLHTRSLQWSEQDEGPPCLSPDSFAYRFAGFGTHEWIIYYDLVRHLLWSAPTRALQPACPAGDPASRSFGRADVSTPARLPRRGPHLSPHASPDTLNPQDHETLIPRDRETFIADLNQLKSGWLEQPNPDYEGRIPGILMDNERKRLPIALRPRDMIIDDDCPVCQMFGDETSPHGRGVGFWHLDGCNMDDDFAFSFYKTRQEWEAENRRREEFNREFNRRMDERKQRIARGEPIEHDPFLDPDPMDFAFDDSTSL